MRLTLTAILVGVLLSACPGDPPDENPQPLEHACAAFGVTDPAPVPETCPLEVAGDGGTVRVFAVGQVVHFREMNDYAAFCRTWDEVVRTQVLPCLAEDKPNLLVFPENAALSAAFIGTRGAASRAAETTTGGFLPFFESYTDPYVFYVDRFPAMAANARLLVALTDTLNRAFQTFPAIARTYGVHVAVSSDLAPAELSADPAVVSILADPDLQDVASVWVATEGATYNWGVFFGPDGEELARIAKTYLVPAEKDLLMLEHGPIDRMRPVDLPFARAGMVISKDAWMPDLLHRLDALGADLMLQPEAFSGWAVQEYEGDWLPDIVKQSGWGHTQRHGAFRYNVTPCIKGNLLDMVYDCQSHLAADAHSDQTPMGFIGQPPSLGFLAIEPWVVADPGPPATLEERRAELRAVGERLAPGSGDPLEDAYTNAVVVADLGLPADGTQPAFGDGPPGALGASRAVLAPIEQGHQRFPSVASEGARMLVAFSEGDPGGGALRVAQSEDGGASFAAVGFFDALPEGPLRRTPSVALAGTRLLVAWEEEDPATGRSAVHAAVSLDQGATWTQGRVAGDGAEAWSPGTAVDSTTGDLHVVWLDLRHGGRPKPYLASSPEGVTWSEVQVDPGNEVVDDPRGNAAFPQVAAAAGRVHVAFLDFRRYAWDVYLSTRQDAGTGFAAASRVNPTAAMLQPAGGSSPVEAERLHADVQLALDGAGAPLVSWADLQDRRVDTRGALLREGELVRIDDAPEGVDAFRPAFVPLPDGTVVAAWQDHREGPGRLRIATLAPGASAFGPSAVLDDAHSNAQVVRPRLAPSAGGVTAVWEDWRSGRAVVRVASGSAP